MELDMTIKRNETVILDATDSQDPDGHGLNFYWFHYKEAGTYKGDIIFDTPSLNKTSIAFKNSEYSGLAHIILQVKDNVVPCLYRYARFIITIL